MTGQDIAGLFLSSSVARLRQMTGFIEDCLGRLNDEQIWMRGASHENTIGNLILHLCGNARQWIIAGVGGAADRRDRPAEFAAQGDRSRQELLELIRNTVNQAAAVIESVGVERLTETIKPQDRPVTVLEAIYQVVGHFQQHTGQIIFATKILSGEDLGLYPPKK